MLGQHTFATLPSHIILLASPCHTPQVDQTQLIGLADLFSLCFSTSIGTHAHPRCFDLPASSSCWLAAPPSAAFLVLLLRRVHLSSLLFTLSIRRTLNKGFPLIMHTTRTWAPFSYLPLFYLRVLASWVYEHGLALLLPSGKSKQKRLSSNHNRVCSWVASYCLQLANSERDPASLLLPQSLASCVYEQDWPLSLPHRLASWVYNTDSVNGHMPDAGPLGVGLAVSLLSKFPAAPTSYTSVGADRHTESS
ncbi:hypothetical protein GWK47_042763 [Chionoecetes opilio]|uniref:Uncharacterized protein n=1 Tax=Chionoecetes opilio TaxID=41210 RepID=A0A8J4YHL8_CHIOP|nr:hypothetical protein GWK47_042763 [Chionoecetes opilio]